MIFDSWMAQDPVDAPQIPLGHPVLRAIAARRGVTTPEQFERYTRPSLDHLHDPMQIHGMEGACLRIERAIRDRESVLIYGDYDVDGVTSIVLLRTVLRHLGAEVDWVVPLRLTDGYGLKTEVIERTLREKDVRVIVTVDCGISSVEPVQRAIELGIDVIITDHHLPPGTLPEAAALLNPKIDGCSYPFKELAGVGVAFKLCCALLARAGSTMSIESLLKIAAIGTIADVAPLLGENRTIAQLGLRGLADCRNPGLRTLIRLSGVRGTPRAQDVGFRIGPRINAAGRLASAGAAIDLFDARSDEEAYPIVMELNRLNAERQEVERGVIAEAEAMIDRARLPRVIVLASERWHKGVVGLCAGRLAQKFHRPTILLSIAEDRAVGSGRSIPGIHLHALLSRQSDLFEHFGGHEQACGLTLPAACIGSLRDRLIADLAAMDESAFRRISFYEGEISTADVNRGFARDLATLEPFGAENPEPLFLIRRASILTRRQPNDKLVEVVADSVGDGARCVAWRSVEDLWPALQPGQTLDLLGSVREDGWAPSGAVFEVRDVRPPTDAERIP
jgi:single-stranded-DNA-specific exonuclease